MQRRCGGSSGSSSSGVLPPYCVRQMQWKRRGYTSNDIDRAEIELGLSGTQLTLALQSQFLEVLSAVSLVPFIHKLAPTAS